MKSEVAIVALIAAIGSIALVWSVQQWTPDVAAQARSGRFTRIAYDRLDGQTSVHVIHDRAENVCHAMLVVDARDARGGLSSVTLGVVKCPWQLEAER